MPVGIGLCPVGSSPYGFGTPDAAPIPGGKPLRDTLTGAQLSSRKIDPRTKDYTFDAFGRIVGMTQAQQLVQLALSTDKGSSAIRNLGHELRTLTVISANFTRRVEELITQALAAIVQRGLIEIVQITVERVGKTGAFTRVRWRDTSTKSEHENRV